MGVVSWIWDAMPFTGMVLLEFMDVGMSTISKAAMTGGLNNYVFVVYYNALGTLILLPHFIFHRSKRAPLTFSLLCVFFLLGLIGGLAQILSFTGIKYSSPILSSAMTNLIPGFTFLLAVIFRMESLDLRRSNSRAKFLGTIVAISGAFMVTLYKGPSIHMASTTSNFSLQLLLSYTSNWVFGGLLLALACLLAALWNVVQATTMTDYPEVMAIAFIYCFFSTVQCVIFSLIVERDPHAWELRLGIDRVAIFFVGIGNVFRIIIHTWCLNKKGPVYVSMFKPLGIAITVVIGVGLLSYTLHLGSAIGAIIIALGFYTVMWGISKEKNNEVFSLTLSTQKTPLLQDQI